MPNTSLPLRGGGVDDAVGQRLHAHTPLVEGGDDVDQVARVAAEPVDLPGDQGVAGAQVIEAGLPLGPVGAGACGAVDVGLQAALGGQGVELEAGVLVGGGHPRVADLVAHWPGAYRNP
jgi:hypothetical protein